MSLLRVQVFLVDIGTMYNVNITMDRPVLQLKEEIQLLTKIPVDKQVMLVSGGVPLFPDKPLSHYTCLSDNTVYLVCKSGGADIAKLPPPVQRYSDQDLTSQVEAAIRLPAALETVRARMLLAQRICEVDEVELSEIRQLVFDQHLQQQGWAAVVANLDDLVSGFEKRGCAFQKQYGEYLKSREDNLALLRRMPEVLILLGKIPVLPCLENMASNISVSLRGPMDMQPSFTSGSLTLYHWMNAQDPKYKLEDVISDVTSGTNQMGEQLEERVSQEINALVRYATDPGSAEMKSIKGLEDRLYSLDKLTCNAKTTVDGQISTKEGFKANWQRLEAVKDNSILPDLCDSHTNQMKELLVRHQKLLDLKKKCADAKTELSGNIRHRLNWVMATHHAINDMDNKLMLNYDLLNRVHTRVKFLREVEKAPQVYAHMVVEVVRRRLFSQHYMKWATGVAEESGKEHKKEIHRRKSFSKRCGSHFLQKLFTGFKDVVPKFATEAPKDIDSHLPDITATDISHLSHAVPELQHLFRIPTGTGSPALASSLQHPAGQDGGSDPFMIEASLSLASSSSPITRSTPSVTQSLTDSIHLGLSPLLGERDKMSLSYQGEGGPPADTKEQLFLSLQDKFPVPQCLSETLTAEVNSAAMSTISVDIISASPKCHELSSALEDLGHQQQQQEGAGDAVLLSSGDLDHTKSSDSDLVSHESFSEHKPRAKRRHVKGLSDTSPDAETSQEFTTADFYIEDSMPSSITDSAAKASAAGKDQGEVVAELAEKNRRVGELEGDVSALQSKLAGYEDKLGGLQALLSTDISAMRAGLSALRDSVQHTRGEKTQLIHDAQAELVRVCAGLLENMEREKQQLVEGEREGGRRAVGDLQDKLLAKSQAMDELQQGMLKVSQCMADLNKELQHQRETYQRDVDGLKEQHQEEVKRLRQQTILEVELETDRVRTEMQQSMDRHEADAQSLHQQLEEMRAKFNEAVQEKEALSETLLLNFTEEKRQLHETLEAEKQQTIQQLHTALMAEAKKETAMALQRESEYTHGVMQKQLEELKLAHEKQLSEREEELVKQHQAEVERVREEWSGKLADQEADLQAEFDLKLETTKRDLQHAAPQVSEAGTQTCQAPVTDQGLQTDTVCADVREQGLQTQCAVSEQSVQCQVCGGSQEQAAQTEASAVTDQGVQSDLRHEVCHQHVQSEERPVKERAVQSDAFDVCDHSVQSDKSEVCDHSVQSEGRVVCAEHHERLLHKAVTEGKEQVSLHYEQMLAQERRGLESRLMEMERQHQQDKEEAVHTCTNNILAERQVNFNEAVACAVKEKDTLIEELRVKLSLLSAQGEGEGESVDIRKQLADIKEKESHLKREKGQLENEVALLQHQLRQYSEQVQSMTASTLPLSVSSDSTPLTHSAPDAMAQSISLEQAVQLKDQRISELEAKLMGMSMTASVRKEVKDKVSILTCNVGDLVLLCLDERHNQYVVFTVGTTLHFLHSDCIDMLGLRSAEGELRKNWVLAEVTEREYCQARKAQNRFKVPVNTKFYRVKAKPWVPKSSSTGS